MIGENLSGPQVDRYGYRTTYFMYVDSAGATEDSVVAFESPIYNSLQHREECFHFYFALTVNHVITSKPSISSTWHQNC